MDNQDLRQEVPDNTDAVTELSENADTAAEPAKKDAADAGPELSENVDTAAEPAKKDAADAGPELSDKEKKILAVIEGEPEERYAAVTWERKDPDLLYQLSPWRANLLNWLPIHGTDRVLEMQAGYGPATADLAGRAAEVVCLEQTEGHYVINSRRQQSRHNVECGIWNLAGDDIQVQKYLKKEGTDTSEQVRKFDWVIIYRPESTLSLRSDLELASAFVEKNGRIVLAVDNSHGMRTRDGAPAPHGSATRQELKKLFDELGMQAQVYYPYQSLEFTDSVYTDTFLPRSEELGLYEQGFFRPRICWCDEQEEYAYALENGLYPEVANAFLCILTPPAGGSRTAAMPLFTSESGGVVTQKDADDGKHPEVSADNGTQKHADDESGAENGGSQNAQKGTDAGKKTDGRVEAVSPATRRYPIYVKFSNQRKAGFNTVTSIYEDDNGQRQVFKRAFDEASRSWVTGIASKYLKLAAAFEGTGFLINRCSRNAEGIELEYVTGKSLDTVLDMCLENGRPDLAELLIDEYWRRLTAGHPMGIFTPSPEYREIFGEQMVGENEAALPVTNIDMIFSNILLPETLSMRELIDDIDEVKKEKWDVIDYEWTFPFPIPVRYVMYRALDYFQNYRAGRKKFVGPLFARYGIRTEDMQIYAAMESEFQKWILGDTHPIRLHNSVYGKPSMGFRQVENDYFRLREEFPAAQSELQTLRETEEKLRKELQDAQEQNSSLNEQLESLQKDYDSEHEKVEKLDASCVSLSETVNQMRGAFSWKVTAPMRAVMTFFRRFFHRNPEH